MSVTKEQMMTAAKWCFHRYDLLAQPRGADWDEYHSDACKYPCIFEERRDEWVIQTGPLFSPDRRMMNVIEPLFAWLLTPEGRDAMERALLDKGYQIKEALTIEGVGVSIRRVGDFWTDGDADTIAASLVLAICQLAEKEATPCPTKP